MTLEVMGVRMYTSCYYYYYQYTATTCSNLIYLASAVPHLAEDSPFVSVKAHKYPNHTIIAPPVQKEMKRERKYNSWDSLVITHPTTSHSAYDLYTDNRSVPPGEVWGVSDRP